MTRLIASLLLAALALAAPLPLFAAASPAPVGVQGRWFVDAAGQPVFPLGANYEGPADDAWQMWADDRFDADAIGRDFERARAANLSLLRLFVQAPLDDDIRAAHWAKLDAVLDRADAHELRVILAFNDAGERDLGAVVGIEAAVAARYAGRATIFAYDLRNEPHFGDLALATYPPGLDPPLLRADVVPRVGETLRREDVPAYRASDAGQADIPRRLTDDQAYVYANVVAAYRAYLADASAWAVQHDATAVEYAAAPESEHWAGLETALNDTLGAWLRPQLDALHAADPGRPVTVGYSDPILAALPVNAWLDFRSLHQYPAASSAAIAAAIRLFDAERAAVPDRPLVLGEFGFSNATLDEDRSAALEIELLQAAWAHGAAATLKWMLNDFPSGFNPRENAFGMYRPDGTAKPLVPALQALTRLAPIEPSGASAAGEDHPLDGGFAFAPAVATPAYGGVYTVTDDGAPFWDTYSALGGAAALGRPLGQRFLLDGRPAQAFERGALLWIPEAGRMAWVDALDLLHRAGKDAWLDADRQIPPAVDRTAAEAGLPDEQVVARRLALLAAQPELRARYLATPDWRAHFGLPVAVSDGPLAATVRGERGVLQRWKTDVPWAQAGSITEPDVAALLRDSGLLPGYAVVPVPSG